jgi:hypothetical protein
MHSLAAFAGDDRDVARKNGYWLLISAAKAHNFNMLPGQRRAGAFYG